MNLIKKLFGQKKEKPCCTVVIKEQKEDKCCAK